MANCQKHSGGIGGLFSHFDRSKETEENNKKHSNEEIDSSRSYMNYNLAPLKDMSQNEIFKKRLSEVHVLKRKDVNVLCTWIVTLPKTLKESESDRFFKTTYEFLEERYGKKNVVSAHVHRDETSDHMHFAFVPVVYDQKKDREKVCAKEVINRNELKAFHDKLSDHLEKEFGYDVGVLNQNTAQGNKTIKELKATELNQLSQIQAKSSLLNKNMVSISKDEYELLKAASTNYYKKESAAKEEIQELKNTIKKKDVKLDRKDNKIEQLHKDKEHYFNSTTKYSDESRKLNSKLKRTHRVIANFLNTSASDEQKERYYAMKTYYDENPKKIKELGKAHGFGSIESIKSYNK